MINVNEIFEDIVERIDKTYSKKGTDDDGTKTNKLSKGKNKQNCC